MKSELIRLNQDLLVRDNKADNKVSFECIICFEPLDLDTATECIKCEVAICKKDKIKLEDYPCPNCRSYYGFKENISRYHR